MALFSQNTTLRQNTSSIVTLVSKHVAAMVVNAIVTVIEIRAYIYQVGST